MKSSDPNPCELLLAYLDNDLDARGVTRLSDALEHDHAFRREAATIVVQELQLHRLSERGALGDLESVDESDSQPWADRLKSWLVGIRGLARRPLAWAVATLALAVVLALVFLRETTGPRFIQCMGKVTMARQGRTFTVTNGLRLRADDRIELGAGAFVELAYPGETTSLRFWDSARMVIGSAPKTFHLQQGEMAATVAPQPAGAPMRIQTPHGSVTVVGTEFNVAVTPRLTRLEVWKGMVRLEDGAGAFSATISRGEFAELSDSGSLNRGLRRQGVERECWLGEAVPADRPLAELSCLARRPDFTQVIEGFSSPPSRADGYVSRLRASLRPPETGFFEFWVAGDDRAELWLSSDDRSENKRRICWTTDWTPADDWEKYASQKSQPVFLQAGRKYYLEALHYDQGGGDFVAAAWKTPRRDRESIPADCLSPDLRGGAETP